MDEKKAKRKFRALIKELKSNEHHLIKSLADVLTNRVEIKTKDYYCMIVLH